MNERKRMNKEFFIKDQSGRELIGNSWIIDNPIANIVIAHGMAEYSMRYDRFAKYLNSKGYNVYMLDHIGHGKNQYLGQGVWPKNGFNLCVDNLDKVILSIEKDKLPIYLMGHSMGSFMVQFFIENYHHESIKKVVLIGSSGPQFVYKLGGMVAKIHAIGKDGTKRSPFLNNLAFSSYNKKIKNKKSNYDWVVANQEALEKYIADPECGFIPSINFFQSFLGNLAKLHKEKNIEKIDKNKPVLLVAGIEDPVGNYGKAVKKLHDIYQKVGIPVEIILYENMRHEILNEIDCEKVYQDITNFIKK